MTAAATIEALRELARSGPYSSRPYFARKLADAEAEAELRESRRPVNRPRVACAPADAPRCRYGYYDFATSTSWPCTGPAVEDGKCCWHARRLRSWRRK